MKCLGVLVSGNGSNLQSIMDSTSYGILKGLAKVVLVISNNPNAYALKRAEQENVKFICVERESFKNDESFNDAILVELQNMKVDIVCLAGYLKLIGKKIIKNYYNKVLNIHPALLPKFGGKGMYGYHVHEAVVKSGETVSGATVHLVDENYDTGKIIIQKEVKVFDNDTPQDVAEKVLTVEHKVYPEAIKILIESLSLGDGEFKKR
ncbi:MAG: phosphoribosylglycinamide formyltransferase [Endomicrobium sp.]|jgi:phosphoribosylglycinamide formyltransferase-1|nr:phosphoribosylglycinamide formyltransferase [Endomicrobium sp.]